MNIDKLKSEVAKANAKKASDELDRMIKLHEDGYTTSKEAVKLYLLQVGTVIGKSIDYAVGNVNTSAMASHKIIISELEALKKDLE